jgi:hypothetical protein
MKKMLPLILAVFLASCSHPGPEAGLEKVLAALGEQTRPKLDTELAARFAELSLRCIDREYPNKPSNVLDSDAGVKPPRELTPAFFGCFDWHSAVHGHWALLRLLKTFPDSPRAKEITQRLDEHLAPGPLARELAYFGRESNRTFERPYGWGWLLRLAAELHDFDGPRAAEWRKALQPLSAHLSERMIGYLELLSVPVREGTHSNTAFALAHAYDYARITGDEDLRRVIERRARQFYSADENCPTAYEPSGEDFLSPCLSEADLMRRIMPRGEFSAWLEDFLPPVDSKGFAAVIRPVEIRDLKDPKIGHLIGLSLQRAWCYEGIAGALSESDPRRGVFLRSARLHASTALGQMFESGYGGEHWLASFAIYLLTDTGL